MIANTTGALLLAFLLGAFPMAYVVGRCLKKVDIRQVGTRNPGALNTYQQVGKWAGLAVLVVDAGKGTLAVFAGQRLDVTEVMVYVAALLAVLGHNFSPFLRFRGGKGVATALGASAILDWQVTAISLGGAAVLFALTRHVVISAFGFFIFIVVVSAGMTQPLSHTLLLLALSSLVIGTHWLREFDKLWQALKERQWRRLVGIQ